MWGQTVIGVITLLTDCIIIADFMTLVLCDLYKDINNNNTVYNIIYQTFKSEIWVLYKAVKNKQTEPSTR